MTEWDVLVEKVKDLQNQHDTLSRSIKKLLVEEHQIRDNHERVTNAVTQALKDLDRIKEEKARFKRDFNKWHKEQLDALAKQSDILQAQTEAFEDQRKTVEAAIEDSKTEVQNTMETLFTERAKLESEQDTLKSRQETLEAEKIRVQADKDTNAVREIELDEREQFVNDQETESTRVYKEVQHELKESKRLVEAALEKRDELSKREEVLEEKENQVMIREANAELKEKKNQNVEDTLFARSQELDERERKLRKSIGL